MLTSEDAISGPLTEVSAFTMKHPQKQMRDTDARERLERWIAGR
jgi:myo-inositol-1-phosphate synthase